MQRSERHGAQLRASLLVVGALILVGCSDDDDDLSVEPNGDGTEESTDEPVDGGADDADDVTDGLDVEGSVGDDLLLVPRAYLQGEWCDSDGGSWMIEGDTAVLTDGTGGRGEFPIDVLFIAAPGTEVISQTDDQFTIGAAEQVTFTRGSC